MLQEDFVHSDFGGRRITSRVDAGWHLEEGDHVLIFLVQFSAFSKYSILIMFKTRCS